MRKINDLPDRVTPIVAEKYSQEYILSSLNSTPKAVRSISQFLAGALGKGFRTKLLIACAMGEDGLVPSDAIYATAAVEIFHMATLVHDDIIDDAEIRRGLPSVQSQFGKKEAVVCGDFLLCVAIRIISHINNTYPHLIDKFALAVERVCLGEMRQLSNNFNMDISFLEYMRIIHGKTAALFSISAYGGGLLASEDEGEIKQLSKLGTYIGMTFQMQDDCKDYLLSDKDALKPTKNDIVTGVVNLPLLLAFLKDPSLRSIAKEVAFDRELVKIVFDKVNILGGVKASQNIIDRYKLKINKIIAGLKNRVRAEALSQLIEAI